ncbi:MAG: ABC transporter permease [Thermoanaerobaculia bacterium]
MFGFVLRRLAVALATLLGVLTLVFLFMSLAPGDPARLAAHGTGRSVAGPSAEALDAFRTTYGLDRPLPARFGRWLLHAFTLDFGRSFQDGRAVRERIVESIPATLFLNAGALLLAILIAVPCGVFSARHPGGGFDRISGVVFDVTFAAPSFVIGMLLLLVFAVRLGWTPLFADAGSGWRGIALPIATLALASVGFLARFVRSCVLDALRSTAALAARARGEGAAAQITRALRRSAVPFAAMAAALVPTALSGSVLVERLFAIRGSGGLLAEAVFARDTPTILGLTLFVAAAVVVASVLSDLVSAIADPRTRDEPRTEAIRARTDS